MPSILLSWLSAKIQTAPREPEEHVAIARNPFDTDLARTLWIVGIVALLTSALYFWRFQNFYYPDSPSYIVPAENLLKGHGFTGPGGNPESFRTPGYPGLLALFLWANLGLKAVVVFQHILRVLMILGATAFAFRISHSQRLSLLTGLVLAIDFPLLEAANAILTEFLFTAVMVAVYWLLWKVAGTVKPGGRLLATGLLAGASVLIRPISILFFVPAIVFLALTRPQFRIRAAVIFVAGFACLPSAWAIRNHYAIGRFTISTISGFSALQYRAAGALAIERPGDFRQNFETTQKELEAEACSEMSQRFAQDCSKMTDVQKSEFYSRLGRQIVLQHPVSYLKVSARGAAVMMLDGGPTTLTGLAGTSWPTGMRLLMIYTFPILLLAVWGLWEWRKADSSFFWLALVMIGYFVLISAGPEAYARFRVPFLPIYAILTAKGLDSLLSRFHR